MRKEYMPSLSYMFRKHVELVLLEHGAVPKKYEWEDGTDLLKVEVSEEAEKALRVIELSEEFGPVRLRNRALEFGMTRTSFHRAVEEGIRLGVSSYEEYCNRFSSFTV